MTDLEKRAIVALRSVKMPEKNWHAGRAESLNMLLTIMPETRLGISQEADLWFLVWRYRRQIAERDVVQHACELVKGERSLSFE